MNLLQLFSQGFSRILEQKFSENPASQKLREIFYKDNVLFQTQRKLTSHDVISSRITSLARFF